MIYFDAAATTKPSKIALDCFNYISENFWFNPSSTVYDGGIEARRFVEKARRVIADGINAEPEQIFFTSGSTEAANWILRSQIGRNDILYCSPIEHPCVHNAVAVAERATAYRVRWFDVDRAGVVNDKTYIRQFADDLVNYPDSEFYMCIMGANNELGTMQRFIKAPNIKFICDMTQVFAHGSREDIDVQKHGFDFAFGSAQKFGGFKGTGFLYVKEPDKLKPFMYGGLQEGGLRPGTENVAGIWAMACQFQDINRMRNHTYRTCKQLRNYITGMLPSCARVNGGDNVLPNIISVTLDGIDANKLIAYLNMDGIYLSAGSACSTGENKPSRVLKACGFADDEARSTIRISFTTDNTVEEATKLINRIDYHIKGGMCQLE